MFYIADLKQIHLVLLKLLMLKYNEYESKIGTIGARQIITVMQAHSNL